MIQSDKIMPSRAMDAILTPPNAFSEEGLFTAGMIPGRRVQGEIYDISYFNGGRRNDGVQFPANGAFLDPESEYRFKFQDIAGWINRYVTGGRILDVGCGPGHLGYWSKKLGFPLSVIGCDISLPLLQSEYNQNPSASIGSSAYQLPFKGGRFSGVLFSDVLEHVLPRQAVGAVQEANRLLQDNGHIFINIPNRQTWSDAARKDQGHVWLPTIKEVRALLAMGGFEPDTIKVFTRGFPSSRPIRRLTGQDLKLPYFGRSIFACAQKSG